MPSDGDDRLAFAREHPDPKDPSARYTTTWFDMFRIKDGKIVEHWDVIQPVPEKSANANTMF